jgi:hypothetical protein
LPVAGIFFLRVERMRRMSGKWSQIMRTANTKRLAGGRFFHFFMREDLQIVPKLINIRIVVSTKHVRVLTERIKRITPKKPFQGGI